MPELPDIELYLAALEPRITGRPIERIRLATPFLLRSVAPPLDAAVGKRVIGLQRLGKRIVWRLEDELFLIFHLMIAGRFRWRPRGAAVAKRIGLAAFDFEIGTLLLTEASARKRASLYVARGVDALASHDPGGADVREIDVATFADALRKEMRSFTERDSRRSG